MNKAALLAEIDKLTTDEQIDLVGDVWDRIADNPANWPPVPPEHLEEAKRRLAEHRADPSSAISIDELYARLRSRLK